MEIDQLYGAWMSDQLDEGQRQRLIALLADAGQRRRWRALACLDGALAELGSARRAEPASVSMQSSCRLVPVDQRKPLSASARWHRWPLLASAAAILVLVAATWIGVDRHSALPVAMQEPQLDGIRLARGAAIIGPAELAWDDGSVVHLVDRSRAEVLAGAPGIALIEGTVVVATAPPASAAGFSIRTQQVHITVEGTRFIVDAASGETRVAVQQGAVAVRDGATLRQRIVAGGSATFAAVQPVPVPTQSATGASTDRGLIAWWPLDEGHGRLVRDAVGQADGAITGATWIEDGGRSVLHLPGGDARVDLPPLGALATVHAGDYSVSAWFRPAAVVSASDPATAPGRDGSGVIIGRTGWTIGLQLDHSGHFLMQHFLIDRRQTSAVDPHTARTNRWYHLAGIVDRGAGATRLVVDGELAAQRRWPAHERAFDFSPDAPWRIGISSPTGAIRWPAQGDVRDVRIHARALTIADCAAFASR